MARQTVVIFMSPPRHLTERACNDPRRMRARKTEAEIVARMPPGAWLSCTAVSRLIGDPDDRRIRARLDRLVRDGKMECKREKGAHGPVYLFRRSVQNGPQFKADR